MNEFFPDDTFGKLKTAYRAGREIDRLRGLLRFTPNREGVFIARCAPDFDILPALAEHFTLRFGETAWAIIDERRGRALVREKGKKARVIPWTNGRLAGEAGDQPRSARGGEEDPWEKLWKNYHRAVNNESRANPKLQKQFLPERYWKYLPEME
ncbi:MAG: TIGR03915 family putative DNA repair protein [Spirochaetia bacterium]|jgi:probable DNA metabolism protein|nr:TIGR03915 family putative DNA repair protein [Spirochaetia bacterium]